MSVPKSIGPYSMVKKHESFLYLSGQLPIDPQSGGIISDCVKEQTRQSIQNIVEILKQEGGTLQDVIKVTIYLSDINDFQSVNEVYGELFTPPYPARSAFQVGALPMGAKVEIEVLAATQKACCELK